jgi:hypothetical protein
MIPVSKEVFYAKINPMDIVGDCQKVGQNHYRTVVKTRNGQVVGKVDTVHTHVMTTTYALAPGYAP